MRTARKSLDVRERKVLGANMKHVQWHVRDLSKKNKRLNQLKGVGNVRNFQEPSNFSLVLDTEGEENFYGGQ